MDSTISDKPGLHEPVWDIATLFPNQGEWSESEYLALETNRLIEYSKGYIEFLPMPKPNHQFILFYLIKLLDNFVNSHKLGYVLPASLRVRLWPGQFREPDIVFVSGNNLERFGEDYCDGADLVVEIVSGSHDDRKRDYVEKRDDYARAGISEYWIVDPADELITVLTLDGDAYVEHGRFQRSQKASSVLLQGFEVDVSAVLDAAPTNTQSGE